ETMSPGELLAKGGPIALLIALVLGGIYGGLFTPIEAGAVGCLGAMVIGLARRSLSLKSFWEVLNDTGLVTASICFLIIAAQARNHESRRVTRQGWPDRSSDRTRAGRHLWRTVHAHRGWCGRMPWSHGHRPGAPFAVAEKLLGSAERYRTGDRLHLLPHHRGA